MSCATSTLKISALILNLLCCTFGILIISANIYSLVQFYSLHSVRLPCIVSIVLGFLLLTASVIGCCGVFKQSVRLLWLFVLILTLVICAQIAAVLLEPINVEDLATETVGDAWQGQFDGHETINIYETEFECCGKSGPDDYTLSGLNISITCYPNQNTTTTPFNAGCIDAVLKIFEYSKRIEQISDWAMIGIEVITGLVTCMFAITLKHLKRRKMFH